jgi:hypothetical protein
MNKQALNQFEKVIRCMKELEDRYTIILKLELFSDVSGDCYFVADTREPWKWAFAFADLDELEKNLEEFDQYIAG